MIPLKATVAYDGSGFHGFAANEGVRTVAGEIEAAVSRISGSAVEITCAGRTDKGVHGRGQVISFAVAEHVDVERLQRSINQLCRPSVVLRDLEPAPDGFDARFSATWRQYRYQVLASPVADPMLHDRTWHVPFPLDVGAMNTAAAALVGTHDFSSFCRRPKTDPDQPDASLVRDVLEAEWHPTGGDLLEFWVRATSFCHQMVRSMVGTTVDVGLGRIDADALPGIIDARDRTAAGRVAPPQGLTLWEVGYGAD